MSDKNAVYIRLNELIKSEKLDIDDYMELVAITMELAEEIVSGSGATKKAIVVSIVSEIVRNSDSDIMKQILTETTISNLIEVIIKASKGVYIVNRVKSRFCCF